MKIKLIMCEGLRDARFAQAVLDYYTDFRPVTGDEELRVRKKLDKLIRNLLGRLEEIYGKDGKYIVIINMQSKLNKLLSDKDLLEAYKDLESELTIIFIADSEYRMLQNQFNCIIFDRRIEDLILRSLSHLKIDASFIKTFVKLCERYNDDVDIEKLKVQLFHLILSAGRCDRVMFSKIFQLIETMKLEKPREVLEFLKMIS